MACGYSMRRRQLLKGIGATGLLGLGVGSAQAHDVEPGPTFCMVCWGTPCPDQCDECGYAFC